MPSSIAISREGADGPTQRLARCSQTRNDGVVRVAGADEVGDGWKMEDGSSRGMMQEPSELATHGQVQQASSAVSPAAADPGVSTSGTMYAVSSRSI